MSFTSVELHLSKWLPLYRLVVGGDSDSVLADDTIPVKQMLLKECVAGEGPACSAPLPLFFLLLSSFFLFFSVVCSPLSSCHSSSRWPNILPAVHRFLQKNQMVEMPSLVDELGQPDYHVPGVNYIVTFCMLT